MKDLMAEKDKEIDRKDEMIRCKKTEVKVRLAACTTELPTSVHELALLHLCASLSLLVPGEDR